MQLSASITCRAFSTGSSVSTATTRPSAKATSRLPSRPTAGSMTWPPRNRRSYGMHHLQSSILLPGSPFAGLSERLIGHCLHFDSDIDHQSRLSCCAGRRILRKILGVDGIEPREVTRILKPDGCLDHIIQ